MPPGYSVNNTSTDTDDYDFDRNEGELKVYQNKDCEAITEIQI